MASKRGKAMEAVLESDPETGEITSASSSLQVKEGYRIKKVVTVPQLKFGPIGTALHIEILGEIHTSKVKPKNADEKSAEVVDVLNLDDDRQYKLIVPAVVLKNLLDEYPEHSYVGKRFYIERLGKRKSDQRYIDYGIAEIEME
jgi:hypothetical protein